MLLGGHIVEGAEDAAGAGGSADGAGDAKVADHGVAIVAQEDVGGLQVAVDDAGLMGVVEGGGDVGRQDAQDLLGDRPARGKHVLKAHRLSVAFGRCDGARGEPGALAEDLCAALGAQPHVVHHKVEPPAVGHEAHRVEGDDVAVAEAEGGACFIEEALDALGAVAAVGLLAQDLHCEDLLQEGVDHAVEFAHPPGGEAF